MVVGKWNYEKHDYEPYRIPDSWNCKVYSDDMSEIEDIGVRKTKIM